MTGRLIAVTGGIACGKSTLARMLERMGCSVLDTDEISRSLQERGGAAVPAIADRFGAAAVAPDGSVDRRALGAAVFADPAARADLEAIMHPMIDRGVREWLDKQGGERICVVLIPLLFEAGYDRKFRWDATVAVVCSREEQIRRLATRGFSREEAIARIDSQMPCGEKARKATYSITNDGSLERLENETRKLLNAISLLPPGD